VAKSHTDDAHRAQGASGTLGWAVRAKRLERGLKLSRLAAASGISASALSQIEHGSVNPSIVTLRRIAAALETPVFSFLGDDGRVGDVVVRREQRKTLSLPSSAVVYQLLTPDLQGSLEVLYYEIEVGGVTFEGGFSHPGEECCVILTGKGRLELGGRHYELAEGDAATYRSDIPHALRNIGDVTLAAMSSITPPHF